MDKNFTQRSNLYNRLRENLQEIDKPYLDIYTDMIAEDIKITYDKKIETSYFDGIRDTIKTSLLIGIIIWGFKFVK